MLGPVSIPAVVPALDQHAAQTMTGSEVDVALGIGGGGAMALTLGPGPLLFLHSPPDSHILGRLQPRGILNFARLIEVKRHAREQDVGSRASDDDGTPRAHTGLSHPHPVTILPGHKVGFECRPIVRKIHRRVVGQVGIHDGHVERVVHLESDGTRHIAFLAHELTGVDSLVIGSQCGNRPRLGIGGQSKLGHLVDDDEVLKATLAGELVTQRHAIIESAYRNTQLTLETTPFLQGDPHLVVMIAHYRIFAPGLAPSLVKRRAGHLAHLEVAPQVAVLEHKAQFRTAQNQLIASIHLIPGSATIHAHGHCQGPVRRAHLRVLSNG